MASLEFAPDLKENFFNIFAGNRRKVKLRLVRLAYQHFYQDNFSFEPPRTSEVVEYLRGQVSDLYKEYPDEFLEIKGESISQIGYQVHSDLIDCGWIQSVTIGGKKHSQITYQAQMFLHFLMNIRDALEQDITIPLTGIEDSLRNAAGEVGSPKSILSARAQTKDLINKLRQVEARLVEVEEKLFEMASVNQNVDYLVRHYLQEVIRDEVEPVMTHGNPLDFRASINGIVDRLLNNEELLQGYAKNLVDGHKFDNEKLAYETLYSSLEDINAGFRNIYAPLERIKLARRKIEIRFNKMVQFMGRHDFSVDEALRHAVRVLTNLPVDDDGNFLDTIKAYDYLPQIPLLEPFQHYSAHGLYKVPLPRIPFKPVRQIIPAPDPRAKILSTLRLNWDASINPDEEVIQSVMNRLWDEKMEIECSSFAVNNIPDFVILDHLFRIESIFSSHFRGYFKIVRKFCDDGLPIYIENKYMKFQDFKIVPVKEGSD